MTAMPVGNNDDIERILAFWFSSGEQPRQAWFRKDAEFDAAIRSQFGALLQLAQAGGLRDWTNSPRGLLAYLLLLDQFSRNAYRDSAQAFAGDALALSAAQAGVASGFDQALSPLQRVFVYLPFEHAEELARQEQAVSLFAALALGQAQLAGYLDYAQRHRAVIARFGRFPHRNALLGRVSTAAELAYLAEPGSGF